MARGLMVERRVSDEVITSPQGDYDTLRYVSAGAPCPYLSGREMRSEAYWADHLDGEQHEHLLERGFRRCGRIVYRPRCRHCLECRQLRIPVADFRPSRSMARITRRNVDVRVELHDPAPTPTKFELYRAYLDAQHDGTMPRTYESFEEFLYDSPTDTCELDYVLGERLIGVSIVDRIPGGLSSVYMYFDPTASVRSLGTFSVLWEIEYCRERSLPHYYLGYYVAGSKTMAYKARFRPNQVLAGEGHWVAYQG
jgi:arginine-tRNA-protein transferase